MMNEGGGGVRSLTRNICLLIKSERFNEGFNNKMDDYFFIVSIFRSISKWSYESKTKFNFVINFLTAHPLFSSPISKLYFRKLDYNGDDGLIEILSSKRFLLYPMP